MSVGCQATGTAQDGGERASHAGAGGGHPLRVAVVTRTRAVVGGIESYLAGVIPALVGRGYRIALFSETGAGAEQRPIPLPADIPAWSVSELGRSAAEEALRAWHPDVLFVHGLDDVRLERRLLEVAPSVLFLHQYRGICISGSRTFMAPHPQPCEREFGGSCLAAFYPRRCGGLNPLTMARDFTVSRERHRLLSRYGALLATSEHVRQAYIRNGVAAARITTNPCPVRALAGGEPPSGVGFREDRWESGSATELRLLFVGRMDRYKGGALLLEALPQVAAALDLPVRATFVGEGPARAEWEAAAIRLSGRSALEVEFAGWLAPDALGQRFATSDLLVVPSIWPEPFGLVGPEAGAHGLPAAAFAAGGIPDWLRDGVNGHLAPGGRPTSSALAWAVLRCLEDPAHYQRLRQGAEREASRFGMTGHLDRLEEAFRTAVEGAATRPRVSLA